MNRGRTHAYLLHPEADAVASAAQREGVVAGRTAYVTDPQCPQCLTLFINSGIVEVVIVGERSTCVDDAADVAKTTLLPGLRFPTIAIYSERRDYI